MLQYREQFFRHLRKTVFRRVLINRKNHRRPAFFRQRPDQPLVGFVAAHHPAAAVNIKNNRQSAFRFLRTNDFNRHLPPVDGFNFRPLRSRIRSIRLPAALHVGKHLPRRRRCQFVQRPAALFRQFVDKNFFLFHQSCPCHIFSPYEKFFQKQI